MKFPFIIVSLRSVVRELRAMRKAADRIADCLERAWPPVDLSGTKAEDQDFITARDHEPDESEMRKRIARMVAEGRESELGELMSSSMDGDE